MLKILLFEAYDLKVPAAVFEVALDAEIFFKVGMIALALFDARGELVVTIETVGVCNA